jgi:hypothetical protein
MSIRRGVAAQHSGAILLKPVFDYSLIMIYLLRKLLIVRLVAIEVPGRALMLQGEAFTMSTVSWSGTHGAPAILITLITQQNFPFGSRQRYAERSEHPQEGAVRSGRRATSPAAVAAHPSQ